MHKIVITGTGMISAAGIGSRRALDAMVSRINLFGNTNGLQESESGSRLPWAVAGFRESDTPWPKTAPWPDFRKYANAAAQQAVAVASLAIEGPGPATEMDAERCGTVVASEGRVDELGPILARLAASAETDPRPLATFLYDEIPDYSYIRVIPSQLGQFVCLATGFRGSNVSAFGEASACGLAGLSLATRLLETEELDRVIVVAVSGPMSPSDLVEFDRDEPFGKKAIPGCGPFDIARNGMLLGYGAAAIVIEREEVARERGAPALAELLACETICAPTRAEALRLALGLVMDQADRSPDVWWAHGTGSIALDLEECRAIGHLIKAPTTSSKGTIGSALESAGVTDVVLAVEALNQGKVPPVGLLEQPDSALGEIDFVVGSSRVLTDPRSAFVTALDHETSAAGAVMIGKIGR